MSTELQIKSDSLCAVIAHSVQASIYSICNPPIVDALGGGDVFVDHLDVIAGEVAAVESPAGDIRVVVPIAVYLVQEASLTASENAVPPGATVAAGQLIATYKLAVQGVSLTLSLSDLVQKDPDPALDPYVQQLKQSLPVPKPVSLAPVFQGLKLPQPGTSSIGMLGGGVVEIRFDAVGPTAPHLFPGQSWGLFIDAAEAVSLVKSMLPSLPLGAKVDLAWSPAGGVARVTGMASAKVPVPDPFSLTVDIPLAVNFSLIPGPAAVLRATVHRGALQLHAAGVPGFLEAAVEDAADGYIGKLFDPSTIGATKIDDTTFFLDTPLPQVQFGGAQLREDSLQADGSGMTIGGPVIPANADWDTLSMTVDPFGLPSWLGTCRGSSSGAPPKSFKITAVNCNGGVSFSSFGKFCDATLLDPNGPAAGFLDVSNAGIDTGSAASIGFSIPAVIAQSIKAEVKLILRTARGVRMINLRHPVVIVDPNGDVQVTVFWVPDCVLLTAQDMALINWVKGKGSIDPGVLNPPPEHPDWLQLVASSRGFEIQLVSLHGLEAGELISFRSETHVVDVTADVQGHAVVPVFLPLEQALPAARLLRVNRKSLSGRFRVRSAAFIRGPAFARGDVATLDAYADGGARLIRKTGERVTQVTLGVAGMLQQPVRLAGGSQEVELNPQPLPPGPPEAIAATASRLPGLVKLFPIPGFESEPVAIGKMKDGSGVVLLSDGAGSARIAGSFQGPIGTITSAGNWSMRIVGNKVETFEMQRR